MIGLIGLLHHIARLIAEAGFKVARGAKEMDRKAAQLAKAIEKRRKAQREREEAKRELERLMASTAIEPGMVVNVMGETGVVCQAEINYTRTRGRKVTLVLGDTRSGKGVP